jgi:hypothetical protein
VAEWEYRKIDLNQQHPRRDDIDILNAAGADGWELVGITSNNMAYSLSRKSSPGVMPQLSRTRTGFITTMREKAPTK